jgi:hypothetical protein
MTVRTSVLRKISIHMAKKNARKGRTNVIYKGTFVSKQSLVSPFYALILGNKWENTRKKSIQGRIIF